MDALVDNHKCPYCSREFRTRAGLKVHVKQWKCKLKRKADKRLFGGGLDLLNGGLPVEDNVGFQFGGGGDAVDRLLSIDETSVKLLSDSYWNELWLMNFCITNDLGRVAQNELREWAMSVSIHIYILFMLIYLTCLSFSPFRKS